MAQAGPDILGELFHQFMEGVAGLAKTYKEQLVPFLLDVVVRAFEHVTARQVDEQTLDNVRTALETMNFRQIAYELATCAVTVVDWTRVANFIQGTLSGFWEEAKKIFAKIVGVLIEFGEFVYNGVALVISPITTTAEGIWNWFTNILAGLAQFIGNFVFGSGNGAKEMPKYL